MSGICVEGHGVSVSLSPPLDEGDDEVNEPATFPVAIPMTICWCVRSEESLYASQGGARTRRFRRYAL
jgi:hypothetical protein